MADSSTGKSDSLDSEGDFIDPLGAKDPLCQGLEDDFEAFSIDLSPARPKLEIDSMFGMHPPRLSTDDDLEDEERDLFVIVDNPEKHTTAMESYITFRVTAKTTRREYENQEYQVRRRYNDFLWLRQRLEDSQPTLLVPPLPEKHSFKRLDRFNQDFVKTRKVALQIFVSRLADHPVLSFNKNFTTFLTAKQAEFAAAKKEGSGFMSRVADSIHNLSASYMMKTRPDEFTAMHEYITQLGEKLGVLERISQRVGREQQDHLSELNEWGPHFTLWSNSEDKMSNALAAMAKSVEKCFLSLQDLTDSTEAKLNQPLKEYMLYTEAIRAVLRRRDAIQTEYEITVDELNKKKEEREQVQATDQAYTIGAILGKTTDVVKQEKLEKLALLVTELSQQVETLNDKLTCSNADLKADMERWHKMKRRDFRELFTSAADRQIQYYQRCLSAWEEAIPKIQHTDDAPTDAHERASVSSDRSDTT